MILTTTTIFIDENPTPIFPHQKIRLATSSWKHLQTSGNICFQMETKLILLGAFFEDPNKKYSIREIFSKMIPSNKSKKSYETDSI